jgi:hypothetical protein
MTLTGQLRRAHPAIGAHDLGLAHADLDPKKRYEFQ